MCAKRCVHAARLQRGLSRSLADVQGRSERVAVAADERRRARSFRRSPRAPRQVLSESVSNVQWRPRGSRVARSTRAVRPRTRRFASFCVSGRRTCPWECSYRDTARSGGRARVTPEMSLSSASRCPCVALASRRCSCLTTLCACAQPLELEAMRAWTSRVTFADARPYRKLSEARAVERSQ